MRWLAVLLLSGCSSILGIDDFKLGDGGMTGDGRDAPETGFCLGPIGTAWRVCILAEPTEPRPISSALNFNTDSGTICAGMQPPTWKAAGQPDACFIIATQINVSAALQATGKRPLVLFASDSITIGAPIDLASHSVGASQIGAGIDPIAPAGAAQCQLSPPGMSSTSAASGGAGGSFVTKGGDGGASSGGLAPGRAPAADAQAPTVLRGGCNGGNGGNANDAGGAGGKGGGAIYLVAGNRITINGSINASGAAGRGGANGSGGGGGGSGGMIVLYAPMIGGNSGVLLANGGGAGGGGGNGGGASGAEPSVQAPQNAAAGGQGAQGGGGTGGNGFSASLAAGTGANGAVGASGAGGGGGGGAGGYIRANVMPSTIAASPGVTVVP